MWYHNEVSAPQLNIAEPLREIVTLTVCFHVAPSVHWHTYILSIFYKYCARMWTQKQNENE